MGKKLLFGLALLLLPANAGAVEISVEELQSLMQSQPLGAITGDSWSMKAGTYLQPASAAGLNILIYGTSKYLNFGTVSGSAGYGVRDNSGAIEFKDSGGSWSSVGTGSGSVTSVGLSVPTGLTVSGSPVTTSGTLAVTFTSGYSIPTTASQLTWDNKWDLESTTIAIANTALTAGDGITLTVNDLDCDTASASVFGCLTAVDWDAFNDKWDLGSTTIAVAYGGTGAASLTDGGILLGSGTGAITPMGVLGDGVVVVGDNATDPVTLQVLTSSTGTLRHEVGGIEADISAITTGGLLRGASSGAFEILALGTAGDILGSTGGQLGYVSTSTLIQVGADPTGTIGLSAVNGSAGTFLRSDGAPALSVAITPTWTNTHTFNNGTYSALFTGGNVGIGTTTPDAALAVKSGTPGAYGVGTPDIAIGGNAGGGITALQIYRSAATDGYIGIDAFKSGVSSANLVLNAANGGNVGIGTTTPAHLLDVDGALRVGIQGDSSAFLLFADTSTTRVGVGTSTPASLFSVGGTAQIQTDLIVNGTLYAIFEKNFHVGSTTKDNLEDASFSTGTSVWPVYYPDGVAIAETAYCKAAPTGSLLVRVGDGTNWATEFDVGAGGSEFTLSVNNVFTDREEMRIEVGSATSTVPDYVTCTFTIRKTP